MSQVYNSKKSYFIKVAFILDRFGGDDKELSKNSIITISSRLFPKHTPCSTALHPRLRKGIKENIFKENLITKKKKTIQLIDLSILEEHSMIISRWEKRIKE
jgi:ATP-dependent phosphoenolpyruvate carboxykinase